jgi:hypothetical protein
MAPLCRADDGKSPTFWTQERETKFLYIASFCTHPTAIFAVTCLVAFVSTFLIWCQNCTIIGSRFDESQKEGFRLINKLVRVTLAVALLSFGTAVFAGTVPIANGGFETGDFTGWTQFGDTAFNGAPRLA